MLGVLGNFFSPFFPKPPINPSKIVHTHKKKKKNNNNNKQQQELVRPRVLCSWGRQCCWVLFPGTLWACPWHRWCCHAPGWVSCTPSQRCCPSPFLQQTVSRTCPCKTPPTTANSNRNIYLVAIVAWDNQNRRFQFHWKFIYWAH